MNRQLALLVMSAAVCAGSPALAADAAAAQALAKKSDCMKCHSVSAQKEGPSFKATAAKFKGQADAEAKLVAHLTTSPKMKSGEAHPDVKSKDAKEIANLAQWILAQ